MRTMATTYDLEASSSVCSHVERDHCVLAGLDASGEGGASAGDELAF